MSMLRQFLRMETLAGFALIAAAGLALLLANSPWSEIYTEFQERVFEIRLGDASLAKPLLLWINDGLMAVFFLLVGLELKREVLEGELSRPSQVVLPLAAAVLGVLFPAIVYWFFTKDDPVAVRGWAIPAATDIAFALGLLAMLGSRVPTSLKTFLLSLAVFDDLAAIIIIALFYTDEITLGRGLGLAAMALLILFNRLHLRRLGPYLMVGAILWFCVLKTGVHATLAGVIVALTIPLRTEDPAGPSPLRNLEHMLHPYAAFLILPLFAFANAGVDLSKIDGAALTQPVTLGIGGGLVVGKLIGTFGAVSLLILTGRAKMCEGANWGSMLGTCALAGVGFTMSLFLGTLAFEDTPERYDVAIRLGVLGGSIVAGALGLLILHLSLPRTDP